MSMPIPHHAALLKFSISTNAGKSHIASIKHVQEMVKQTGRFADAVGCETLRFFNYLFFFGSHNVISKVEYYSKSSFVQSSSRHLEMIIDLDDEHYHDNAYVTWLLEIADHLVKRGQTLFTSPEDIGPISLKQWLTLLAQLPTIAITDATFVPTLEVASPKGGVQRRFPHGVDLGKLESSRCRFGTTGCSLLVLDGDGIKKVLATARRPSLFGMHVQRLQTIMERDDCFDDKLMLIYSSRLELDGLFDSVISRIVEEIETKGYLAQYLGGDELVTIAPVDIVASAVESACNAAAFEISFSCGGCKLSEIECLEDGFYLAERNLQKAKSLTRRGKFNIAS